MDQEDEESHIDRSECWRTPKDKISRDDINTDINTDVISRDDINTDINTDVISRDDINTDINTDVISRDDINTDINTDVISRDDINTDINIDVISRDDINTDIVLTSSGSCDKEEYGGIEHRDNEVVSDRETSMNSSMMTDNLNYTSNSSHSMSPEFPMSLSVQKNNISLNDSWAISQSSANLLSPCPLNVDHDDACKVLPPPDLSESCDTLTVLEPKSADIPINCVSVNVAESEEMSAQADLSRSQDKPEEANTSLLVLKDKTVNENVTPGLFSKCKAFAGMVVEYVKTSPVFQFQGASKESNAISSPPANNKSDSHTGSNDSRGVCLETNNSPLRLITNCQADLLAAEDYNSKPITKENETVEHKLRQDAGMDLDELSSAESTDSSRSKVIQFLHREDFSAKKTQLKKKQATRKSVSKIFLNTFNATSAELYKGSERIPSKMNNITFNKPVQIISCQTDTSEIKEKENAHLSDQQVVPVDQLPILQDSNDDGLAPPTITQSTLISVSSPLQLVDRSVWSVCNVPTSSSSAPHTSLQTDAEVTDESSVSQLKRISGQEVCTLTDSLVNVNTPSLVVNDSNNIKELDCTSEQKSQKESNISSPSISAVDKDRKVDYQDSPEKQTKSEDREINDDRKTTHETIDTLETQVSCNITERQTVVDVSKDCMSKDQEQVDLCVQESAEEPSKVQRLPLRRSKRRSSSFFNLQPDLNTHPSQDQERLGLVVEEKNDENLKVESRTKKSRRKSSNLSSLKPDLNTHSSQGLEKGLDVGIGVDAEETFKVEKNTRKSRRRSSTFFTLQPVSSAYTNQNQEVTLSVEVEKPSNVEKHTRRSRRRSSIFSNLQLDMAITDNSMQMDDKDRLAELPEKIKRSRGRPRKSLTPMNMPDLQTTSLSQDSAAGSVDTLHMLKTLSETAEKDDVENTVSPHLVNKETLSGSSVKRPRGRPRKSLTPLTLPDIPSVRIVDKSVNNSAVSSISDSLPDVDCFAEAVVRNSDGVGDKMSDNQPQVVQKNTLDEPAVKRPRGRIRKSLTKLSVPDILPCLSETQEMTSSSMTEQLTEINKDTEAVMKEIEITTEKASALLPKSLVKLAEESLDCSLPEMINLPDDPHTEDKEAQKAYTSKKRGRRRSADFSMELIQHMTIQEEELPLNSESDIESSATNQPVASKRVRRKSAEVASIKMALFLEENGDDSETVFPRKKKKGEPQVSLEELYRNKNYKAPDVKTWETIAESPATEKDTFGKKRFLRAIDSDHPSFMKLRRRTQKATKNGWDKKSRKKSVLPDEVVQEKLASLWQELDESPEPSE